MFNGNLVVIYAKGGTYKSSLGVSLLNSSNKKCCYINLEGNNHLFINDNVNVINSIDNINDIINDNDIILVDYIELANMNIDDIKSLKNKILGSDKSIILISCCSSQKDLFNDHYNELKEVSDLIITLDK